MSLIMFSIPRDGTNMYGESFFDTDKQWGIYCDFCPDDADNHSLTLPEWLRTKRNPRLFVFGTKETTESIPDGWARLERHITKLRRVPLKERVHNVQHACPECVKQEIPE
jgi:hypothetical protein